MNPVRRREAYEAEERERLAPYAVHSIASRGRVHAETSHAYRTCFQRDRDRVVHCRAFRRLEYKTQVFVYHEGDHYRNRLTHTLEGSAITRTIARALRLNEELAEAVVLAHDLGHTAFGHAGERVLARLMKDEGGFDHNRQSLRVVDWLEDRYPNFRGLNLSSETREGILKHGCNWEHPVPVPPATPQPCLEAQVADAADEIAYLNHDLDDGLRAGLLTPEALADVALWRERHAAVAEEVGEVPESVLHSQVIVSIIDTLVTDLIESTGARLSKVAPADVDGVRSHAERFVRLSPEVEKRRRELKRFLYREFYNHPRVVASNQRAEQVLGDLFGALRSDVAGLPERVRERIELDGEARAIADYVAGMTDRFAISEHRRRFEALP